MPGGLSFAIFTFKAKRETREKILAFDKLILEELNLTERFRIKIVDDKCYNTMCSSWCVYPPWCVYPQFQQCYFMNNMC